MSTAPTLSSSTTAVRIWDLPTRLFHWTLAALVVFLLVSGTIGGLWMPWHMRAGEAVLALLLFRLVWGFVGGHWSRFGTFFAGPRRVIAYVRGQGRVEDAIGHTPTGAWSVFALLAVLGVQAVTGLFAYDDIAFSGPLSHLVSNDTVEQLTRVHRIGEWVVLALVGLHLLAIVLYHLRGHRLVPAMVSGDKSLPAHTRPSIDTARSRLIALVILLICVACMVWIDSLGAAASAGAY